GWRKAVGDPDAGREAGAGALLRRLVWDRFAGSVRDTRVVLVSPDGPLTRLPFAALPGREPGHYLLEERAVVVVPVPQLLPELLAATDSPADPSLLLVGAVDFNAAPGAPEPAAATRSAPRGGLGEWGPL